VFFAGGGGLLLLMQPVDIPAAITMAIRVFMKCSFGCVIQCGDAIFVI
jgi:hypothetical protein